MKCQHCGKRDATVHYKEITDAQVKELHLCAECAEEKGIAASSPKEEFSVPNLLGSMADEDQGGAGEAAGPTACPLCGMTYVDFKASGRLGCSDCYETFRVPLVPLLRRIHRSDRHAGKNPGESGEKHRKAREMRALKERLDRCVRREEFEEAARLRDEIRKLEESDE
jgi:protein arginine kinase activator